MTTPENPFQPQGGPVQDANDWLMGGGVKSFSFKGQAPLTVTGTVAEEPQMQQKRDFESGEPLTWNDGNPRMLMKVVLQTNLPQDGEDDDGKRAVYLEGRKAHAVRDAVRNAGARKLEVGGNLSLTFTSEDEPTRRGFSGIKNFSAQYTAPDPFAATGAPPTADPWNTTAAPAPAPALSVAAPGPAPVGVNPGLVAWLSTKGVQVPAGMDEATARSIASSFPDFPAGL